MANFRKNSGKGCRLGSQGSINRRPTGLQLTHAHLAQVRTYKYMHSHMHIHTCACNHMCSRIMHTLTMCAHTNAGSHTHTVHGLTCAIAHTMHAYINAGNHTPCVLTLMQSHRTCVLSLMRAVPHHACLH